MRLSAPNQLESLNVYRLALLDLELDRYADVKDAGERAGGIWVLGIFSCHMPVLPLLVKLVELFHWHYLLF